MKSKRKIFIGIPLTPSMLICPRYLHLKLKIISEAHLQKFWNLLWTIIRKWQRISLIWILAFKKWRNQLRLLIESWIRNSKCTKNLMIWNKSTINWEKITKTKMTKLERSLVRWVSFTTFMMISSPDTMTRKIDWRRVETKWGVT